MRWSLKNLIQLVAVVAIVLTFLMSATAGYRVNKDTLIESTLDTNRAYAEKLTSIIDTYFQQTIQVLQVNGKEAVPFMDETKDIEKLSAIARRIQTQMNALNSVTFITKDRTVVGSSWENPQRLGGKLASSTVERALEEGKPFISQPYIGVGGELLIFVSVPITAENGKYLGLLGGAIYLNQPNALETLLGDHFYKDGSYVYVVDKQGKIIYHQQSERMNDDVSENEVVKKVIRGEGGAEKVVNTLGISMLAGYSHAKVPSWGIVSQRREDSAVAPANSMVMEMAAKSLPLLLIAFFLVHYLSKKIALPLQKLAYYTESSTEQDQKEKMEEISAWYYEAKQLKNAMLYSLGYFKNEVSHFFQQSTTDGLTKLTNRRLLEETITRWTKNKKRYAVILLDVDKFKRINDTYGHAAGDEVLIYLANEMQNAVRAGDICCRYGGEEFLILLPKSDKVTAYLIAERLRENLESKVSPCGEVITISLGVAAYPEHAKRPAELIEIADQCLYEAKRTGRNRTIVADELGGAERSEDI